MFPTSVEGPSAGPTVSWSNPRTRAIVWQVVVLAVVCAAIAMIAVEASTNLRLRGIASGFDYLGRAADFEIPAGPLHYSARDTYGRALAVGLINTIRVALPGILIAATLGTMIGIARLSGIWIVSTLAGGYVEVVRNTPLLLQLLFWYSLTQALPGPRHALTLLPGVFLCDRGLFLPGLAWRDGHHWLGLAVPAVEWPAMLRHDFRGGMSISPEFAALLIGLCTYTAAFLAEIVRGGVLAVDHGQTEAAAALGLTRGRILRLVVLPQALRMIIPPATSQFLGLTKNSSLAVAIGYPDLISVTNTTLNQTGQAIEAITIVAAIYLTISLAISLPLNVHNRAVARLGSGERTP